MTEPTPRRASPALVVFSAAITVYFLYILLFGRGGQPVLFMALYVIAIIFNLIFLVSVVRRWLSERQK
jgi:hypothetical protein